MDDSSDGGCTIIVVYCSQLPSAMYRNISYIIMQRLPIKIIVSLN